MRSHEKTFFGLVPYDLSPPALARGHSTLYNTGDERFFAPASFGVGRTTDPRSAPRHPLRALLLAASVPPWPRTDRRR